MTIYSFGQFILYCQIYTDVSPPSPGKADRGAAIWVCITLLILILKFLFSYEVRSTQFYHP
ncbi:hypothetical protein HMPREF0322_05444 [Desulfitobacterium hafniense DP7]|uniref:Uncharacterized protein n=1 Tax=Desulfitobacterium hafniense DP7 TaxID=537010 RepID=G9XWS7_DESHA|nr:hypothetical protein HMPREF0322_05444 [Desulfitobacterium hafniense DP7]